MARWRVENRGRRDWPFPPHHVSLRWLAVMLLAPPALLAITSLDPLAVSLVGTVWLAIAVPLAIAALLDWARLPGPTDSRATHVLRGVGRLLVGVLGGVGTLAGVWLVWRVTVMVLSGSASLPYALAASAFAACVVVVGAQLAALPYRRLPPEAHTRADLERHGA
jgi:hypothetical protein